MHSMHECAAHSLLFAFNRIPFELARSKKPECKRAFPAFAIAADDADLAAGAAHGRSER